MDDVVNILSIESLQLLRDVLQCPLIALKIFGHHTLHKCNAKNLLHHTDILGRQLNIFSAFEWHCWWQICKPIASRSLCWLLLFQLEPAFIPCQNTRLFAS